MSVIEFIDRAITSQRPVDIKYMGGTRAGSVRSLIIISWQKGRSHFTASSVVPEKNGPAFKTYCVVRIASIIWASNNK